jgi:hypothetical protein
MIGPATEAARPEAPEAKEPCQKCAPVGGTGAKRGPGLQADTLLRSPRSDRVFGLARVLAEGAGGRPIFLLKIYDRIILYNRKNGSKNPFATPD